MNQQRTSALPRHRDGDAGYSRPTRSGAGGSVGAARDYDDGNPATIAAPAGRTVCAPARPTVCTPAATSIAGSPAAPPRRTAAVEYDDGNPATILM